MQEHREAGKSQASLMAEGAAKTPASLGLQGGRTAVTRAVGVVAPSNPNSWVSAAFSGNCAKRAQLCGSRGG